MKISKSRLFKICQLLLIVCIAFTIAYIFSNSMKSQEQSNTQSNHVGEIIEQIIPPETNAGSFIQKYLRKIAHFSEYGLLGIEIAVYVFFFIKEKKNCIMTIFALPLFIGFLDESIQIISKRGPSVSDIWIDVGGFFTFFMLTYIVALLILFVYERILVYQNKKSENK